MVYRTRQRQMDQQESMKSMLSRVDSDWRGRGSLNVNDHVTTRIRRERRPLNSIDSSTNPRPERISKKEKAKKVEKTTSKKETEESAAKKAENAAKREKVKRENRERHFKNIEEERRKEAEFLSSFNARKSGRRNWSQVSYSSVDDYSTISYPGISLKTALSWNALRANGKRFAEESELMLKLRCALDSLPRVLLKDVYPILNCRNGYHLKNKLYEVLRSIRFNMDAAASKGKQLASLRLMEYDCGGAVSMSSLRRFLQVGPVANLPKKTKILHDEVIDYFLVHLKSWNGNELETPLYTGHHQVYQSAGVEIFGKPSAPDPVVNTVLRHLFLALVDLCIFWCLESFQFEVVSGTVELHRLAEGDARDLVDAVCSDDLPAEVFVKDYYFDGLRGISVGPALDWNQPGIFGEPRKNQTELVAKLSLSMDDFSRLVLKSAHGVLECGRDSEHLRFGFRSALTSIRKAMESVYCEERISAAMQYIRYNNCDRVALSKSFRLFLAAGPLADLDAHFFGGLQRPVIDFFVQRLKKWRCDFEDTPLFTNCPSTPFFSELDCPPAAVSIVVRHVFASLVELCLFWCLELFELRRGAVYVKMFRAPDDVRNSATGIEESDPKFAPKTAGCGKSILLGPTLPYTNFEAVKQDPMIDDYSLCGVEVVHATSRATEYMTSSEKMDSDTD